MRPEGKFRHGREPVRIVFAPAQYGAGAAAGFQTRLVGFDDRWSDWTTETEREFLNPDGGPFTFEVREALLARLLETQREVGAPLISDQEVATIRSQWAEDRSTSVVRKARVFLDILQLEET